MGLGQEVKKHLRGFNEKFALQPGDYRFVVPVLVLVTFYVLWQGHRDPERLLRVGIVSWPGYAGGLVANNGIDPNKDSIFWRKYNLLVKFVVDDDADLVKALKHGDIDVIWSTVDSLAATAPDLLQDQVKPVVLMQVDWSRGGDAIVAGSGIDRIEDLPGKTIAVSISASQWLLDYSLANSSLTESQRKQIKIDRTPGSETAREAFMKRNVEVAVLWEPDVSAVTDPKTGRSGSHVLISTAAASRLIADIMVTRQDFVDSHPLEVHDFIKGWLVDGTIAATNDPMLAVWALRHEPKFADLDEGTIRALLDKTKLATLEDNVEMFGLSGGDPLFDRIFKKASAIRMGDQPIKPEAIPKPLYSTSPLRKVYQEEVTRDAAVRDCEPALLTSRLAVPFPKGKADLSREIADRILGDEAVSLMLGTNPQAQFLIQADEGDPLQPNSPALRRAREQTVIDYFILHADRPRRQFLSANATPRPAVAAGNAPVCIRLELISEDHAK